MSTRDVAGWPDLAGLSPQCKQARLLGQDASHWACQDAACRCGCRNCEGKPR